MNVEQARFNMVEQQVRPWEVLDPKVLELLAEVPREHFVPESFRDLAFADTEIPIGEGQVMLPPRIDARALQALEVKPSDLVYEIGTGSGYFTACLASLGRHVTSIDIHPALSDTAGERLGELGLRNIKLTSGDAITPEEPGTRYDVMAVTGSFPLYPEWLEVWLRPGGRLFVVSGEEPAMEARLITRVGENQWTREGLFETVIPPLVNAPEPARFIF